jgi:hypothetical protein
MVSTATERLPRRVVARAHSWSRVFTAPPDIATRQLMETSTRRSPLTLLWALVLIAGVTQ